MCISVCVYEWAPFESGIMEGGKSGMGIQKASNLEDIIESLLDHIREYLWSSSS